jgi:hypothetical protein
MQLSAAFQARLAKTARSNQLVPGIKQCYKLFPLWYNTLSSDVQS